MNNLMQSVTENLIFVLEFLGIVVLMFVVAYAAEKMAKKKAAIRNGCFRQEKSRLSAYFLLFPLSSCCWNSRCRSRLPFMNWTSARYRR